jgi:DNA-binding response OmpR family regulator
VNFVSTILIVDDEPGMLSMMEALLMHQGYNLAFATSGAEALAKATQLTPDLILLDIMMPDLDGYAVCQRLRTDPLLAEVPIIMVTARDDREARLQGIKAGADDFVSKPFDHVELKARVQTIMRLNRYRRLVAERARFSWVVENADDGYLNINDADAIRYANRQARLLLGLPAQENWPITETFLVLARKQYRLEPQEAWAGWPVLAPLAQMRLRYLVRPESQTAKAFWLQVDLLELPTAPEAARLVRLRDVSAQIASQRDMEKFHRVIFHKLRTPLVGIMGGLELLAHHSEDLSSAEVAEFAQIALKGAQRLRGELEDILQYLSVPAIARAGTGFPLAQLPAVITEISHTLALENATVSGQESLGDARATLSQQGLESILWEVLENSKKFHPEQKPSVEIVVSRPSPEVVRFQISDDGATLSPEQLAKVWSPYYQGEKHFTGEASGMGLGLSMVASLIWEAGGECRIYNREGRLGIVVDIHLPLAKPEAEAALSD